MSASRTPAHTFASGEVARTISGRVTTPFPRIDMTTERRTQGTLARAAAWLHVNAKAEIAARGLLDILPATSREMSPADGDLAELILFDAASLA